MKNQTGKIRKEKKGGKIFSYIVVLLQWLPLVILIGGVMWRMVPTSFHAQGVVGFLTTLNRDAPTAEAGVTSYPGGFELHIPVNRFHSGEKYPVSATFDIELQTDETIRLDLKDGEIEGGDLLYSPELTKFEEIKEDNDQDIVLYGVKNGSVNQGNPKEGDWVAVESKMEATISNRMKEAVAASHAIRKWETLIVDSKELTAYVSVKDSLKLDLDVTVFEAMGEFGNRALAGDFTPMPAILMEGYSRDGKKFSEEGQLKTIDQFRYQVSWVVPHLDSGIYKLVLRNFDGKVRYQIDSIQVNTDKWVFAGPIYIVPGSKFYFKKWSRGLGIVNGEGEVSRLEINDNGDDQEFLWEFESDSTGVLIDDFKNFYALSPDSWFNPFENNIVGEITPKTDYVWLDRNKAVVKKGENNFDRVTTAVQGVWRGGNEMVFRFSYGDDSKRSGDEGLVKIKSFNTTIDIGKN